MNRRTCRASGAFALALFVIGCEGQPQYETVKAGKTVYHIDRDTGEVLREYTEQHGMIDHVRRRAIDEACETNGRDLSVIGITGFAAFEPGNEEIQYEHPEVCGYEEEG